MKIKNKILKDEEVTVDAIEALFKAAAVETDRDDDGDLVLLNNGIPTFVGIDVERKLLSFYVIWGLKTKLSAEDKRAFANKLNDNLILVRFAVTGKDLWFDYNFLYEGGISTFTLVNTYRHFSSICEEVIAENSDVFGKC